MTDGNTDSPKNTQAGTGVVVGVIGAGTSGEVSGNEDPCVRGEAAPVLEGGTRSGRCCVPVWDS